VRDRAAGAESCAPPNHAGAYFAGRSALRPRAPLPWPVELGDVGLGIALEALIGRAWAARPRRLAHIGACVAAGFAIEHLRERSEKARAHALGLTAVTAPRVAHPTVLAGVPVAVAAELVVRMRPGRRTPVPWSEVAAVHLVRAMVRRYAWRRMGGP
jgi:hypothetical protein